MLTPIQQKALEYIQHTSLVEGSSPTLRELCDYMGYRSIGSAQDLTSALVKKGFLECTKKHISRSLRLTQKAKEIFAPEVFQYAEELIRVPCLGFVPAGNPLEAIEEQSEFLTLSKSIFRTNIPKEKNIYAVRAIGQSMIHAGILDGDWLVVNYQTEAPNGSIVIAKLDGDVTCKRLMQEEDGEWYLKPENPAFNNIYGSTTPFELLGKVVALHRTI